MRADGLLFQCQSRCQRSFLCVSRERDLNHTSIRIIAGEGPVNDG